MEAKKSAVKSPATEKFLAEFQSVRSGLKSFETLRGQAIQAFEKQGIPGRKSEEYKYLPMELLLKGDFKLATVSSVKKDQLDAFQIFQHEIRCVLVNGVFCPELSSMNDLPKGLRILDLSIASNDDVVKQHFAKYVEMDKDAFVAQNTAFAAPGICIHVNKSVIVEKPLHILHYTQNETEQLSASRVLIVVEEHAQLKLTESFVAGHSMARSFHNHVTEVVLASHANVSYNKVQDEGVNGLLLDATEVNQSANSNFTINTITLSGGMVRNNLHIVLNGEHIESNLNGLYLTRGTQQVDNHTLVDHRFPHCNSNELYKGIVDERSSATFNGKIFVRKDAQKTNAFQSNRNVLLSDDGTINTKPQLEIYADDVKCSHGTSTGKLDEEKIFYFQSRGLSKNSAKRLLMHAFASEVVNAITEEELRQVVETKLDAWFA